MMGCIHSSQKEPTFRVRVSTFKPTTSQSEIDVQITEEDHAHQIKVPRNKKPHFLTYCGSSTRTTTPSRLKRKCSNTKKGSFKILKGSQSHFKSIKSFDERSLIKSEFCRKKTIDRKDREIKKTFEDGAILEGTIKENSRVAGKLTLPHNITYEGEFSGRIINGPGTLTLSNGTVYQANWQQGKMGSNVKVKYPDGNAFQGTLIDKKKNGYGIFFWADGRKYQGCWKDGSMCGVGKLYKFGSQIVGQWRDNELINVISTRQVVQPTFTLNGQIVV